MFLSPDDDNCSQEAFLFSDNGITVNLFQSLRHGSEHYREASGGVLYPKDAEEVDPDTAFRPKLHL